MDYGVIKGQAETILKRHVYTDFNPSLKAAIEAEYRMWLKSLVLAGHLDNAYYMVDVTFDNMAKELSVFISDRAAEDPLTFIIAASPESLH